MTRTSVAVLLLAVAVTACRKPQPSPDYIAASNRYTNLLAVHQDSAYARPEMAEVIAQLGRVPANSSDHAKAQALLGTIETDKQRAIADEAKRMIAMTPPTTAPNFPPTPPSAPFPQAEAKGGTAEPAPANELAPGSDFAKLNQKYSGCLLPSGPVTMIGQDGGPSEMDGYELHASAPCRTAMPPMASSVLLVRDGKIAWVLPKSSLKTVTTFEDAGAAAPAP